MPMSAAEEPRTQSDKNSFFHDISQGLGCSSISVIIYIKYEHLSKGKKCQLSLKAKACCACYTASKHITSPRKV